MSERIAYFKWRSGRPRWEPGPGLRAQGYRGFDLKDADGKWLQYFSAVKVAQQMNERAAIKTARFIYDGDAHARLTMIKAANLLRRRKPDLSKLPPADYIYVFVAEGRWAKIGFSTSPARRLYAIAAGLPVTLIAAIVAPGTVADERKLHAAFALYRVKNEWFRVAGELANWLSDIPKVGRPTSEVGRSAVPVLFEKNAITG